MSHYRAATMHPATPSTSTSLAESKTDNKKHAGASNTEYGDQQKPPPLDLSHHFSVLTRSRKPSEIKRFYRFFQIPGIGNIAGGMPNAQFFPFDTLEAQAAKPERWAPTPNEPPSSGSLSDRLAVATLASAPNGRDTDSHMQQCRSAATSFKSYKLDRNVNSKDVLDNGDGGNWEDVSEYSKSSDGSQAASHITIPRSDTLHTKPFNKIDLATGLQYGTADGYPPLYSFVRQFTRENLHPSVPYAGGPEVILTCGSTDGMSKTLDLLVDPWNADHDHPEDRPHMLVEKYMYNNVISQSEPRGLRAVPVEVDAQGMKVDGAGGLAEVLEQWDPRDGRRPHLMYTVTMGHNPTGGVLPPERKKAIYDLCQKYDIIIVEDDPYWHLQYPSAEPGEALARGKPMPRSTAAQQPVATKPSSGYEFLDSLAPSYLAFDTDGRVIRLDTFSKTIAPGCRLGWITAQPVFIERLLRATETSTQQPSGFVQATVSGLLLGAASGAGAEGKNAAQSAAFAALPPAERASFSGWDTSGWVRWLEGLRGAYERRMRTMARILDDGSVRVTTKTVSKANATATYGDAAAAADEDSIDSWDDEIILITKTRLYSFHWPRGGMFLWLRVRFEAHPLWMVGNEGSKKLPLIDGPALSSALMGLCVRREHLVLPSTGTMFSANDAIRAESGWAYYRLCFAAVSDDGVEECSKRFVKAVGKFWEIESPEEIEELWDEYEGDGSAQGEFGTLDVADLGGLAMGC